MIEVAIDHTVLVLPETRDELPGLCASYDPPTDQDGGCLRLLEHQRLPFSGTRQQMWILCATNPNCADEGRCPFVD